MIGWCKFGNVSPFITQNKIRGVQLNNSSNDNDFKLNLDLNDEELENKDIPSEIEEVCYDIKFNKKSDNYYQAIKMIRISNVPA